MLSDDLFYNSIFLTPPSEATSEGKHNFSTNRIGCLNSGLHCDILSSLYSLIRNHLKCLQKRSISTFGLVHVVVSCLLWYARVLMLAFLCVVASMARLVVVYQTSTGVKKRFYIIDLHIERCTTRLWNVVTKKFHHSSLLARVTHACERVSNWWMLTLWHKCVIRYYKCVGGFCPKSG